ncbi:MAG TPA: fatty acid desaturase [Stellaceae bacterium]|nr:fatty acid desaturase [Stellaceae bacterium]
MTIGSPARRIADFWWTYEGPTFVLAAGIYGGWAALLWFHASLPWWIWLPPCVYLVALQFSLQHESIHAMRRVPIWLRWALVYPPLGLWLPYPLYNRGHSRHHRNRFITDPYEDPESFYHTATRWQAIGPVWRAIHLTNQTLLGRIVFGPFVRLYRLVVRETGLLACRDFSNRRIWFWHALMLALIYAWVDTICGLPFWQYVVFVAYPAFGIGLIRSFYEHRWAPLPGQRVASVESGWFFGFLFLFNNLHVAHHLRPTIPWYELRGFYWANRDKLLAHNAGYVFPGYRTIAARWLVIPVFRPVHPVRND